MRIAPSRTWFLAALAAVVACFGWNAFRAEEDPNDTFVQDRTESVLYLYLDAPGGTSLDSSASPAALGILLERYAWEIWRQPSTGIEEYRHAQVTPESGAMVTLTRSPETGSFADSILITGDDGRAWTTFAPGGASGAVTVQASAGESNASLCFNFSPTSSPVSEEQWSYSRTEATLTATLTSNTSTDQVPPGENRDLSLAVAYETWDVEYSSAGNSRTVNHTSAPAVGAFVSWSVAMGDGYVAGGAMTDDLGQCPATLTVGSSGGNVRAEVSFSTGSATSATLAFSPAPRPSTSSWSLIGSKLIPTLSGISPPSGTSLAPGEPARISGTLQGNVWDLWSNGTQEESRYSYTTPLAWTTLLAEIQHGGGSLDSSSPTTQGDGSFSTGYTMGGASSRVDLRLASTSEWLASVDFALSEAPPATEGSDPGAWTVLYPDGGYAIQNLTVDGPTYDLHPGEVRTIGGTLYWVSWEVMTNRDGAIEHRITSSSPVAGASLSAGMEYGDATLSSTYLTTGSLGEFSTIMTMGGQESKVTFSSSGSASATASMAFTPPQAGGDQGVKIADESLISVAFESDTAADAATLQPGENVPLRARVLSTSWEVWQNAAGSTELRNHEIRPAIGAIVNFSHVSGPGLMSSTQAETNADGIASVDFMLGAGVSLLRADASFISATASAEARVSPGIWVYDSSQDELELSLSLHGWIETPNAIGATLQVRTTEIWRNLATDATESRQVSYSPAENASIVFNVLDGGIATFGTNPSFTNYTGNTIIEYRSNGAVNVAATATFSGKTITATMQVPQGWGLAGTDEGGTDGSGTTDGGRDQGTGHTTGTQTGEGDGNTTLPPDPDTVPNVSTDLVRRIHSVNWLERGSDGPSGEVTKKQFFRATLERNVTDENGVPHLEVEEVEGERQSEDAILLEWYLQGWKLVGQIECFERDVVEIISSGGGSGMGDLLLAGFPSFDSENSILSCLVRAETIAEFEGDEHVSPSLVTGALASSFDGDPWEEAERMYFASLNGTGGPGTDQADYVASPQYPEASWSEYWLESGSTVDHDTVAKTTYLVHVTRRNQQFTKTGEWVGSVTFKIVGNASTSNRKPVLTGFEGTDAENWIVAKEDGRLLVKPDVVRGALHEVSILPVEFTLHQRGTINAPGAAIPRPVDSNDVYEMVTLENADFDEQTDWSPNSMASADETNRQDGATEAVDMERDDDFVKIRLHAPRPQMPGSIDLVMDQTGQGDRMQTGDLRFYNNQGERVPFEQLRIDDLQDPQGPLAPMLQADGLDLFVEIPDLGQLTRAANQAIGNQRSYADLILRLTLGGHVTEMRARIHRGGYWRNQRNGNTGTIAFYDGKGRYQDQNGTWQVDVGNLVHGPFNILSGTGTTDETVRGSGPTPIGWYGLFERLDFNPDWQFNQKTQRWIRPQQDHNFNHPSGGRQRPPLQDTTAEYWQQGSYSQWSMVGNRTTYTHRGAATPPSVQFKVELVNWGHNAHGRDLLQIHPDGWNDGTAGCVGIQTYNDCCRVFFHLRHYYGTQIHVETP